MPPLLPTLLLAGLALSACGGESRTTDHRTLATGAAAGSPAAGAQPAPRPAEDGKGGAGGAGGADTRSARGGAIPDSMKSGKAIVRGLYVNRWATQSAGRMKRFIEIADGTEVNALVLDMKDEFGLNYRSENPRFARFAGTAGTMPDMKATLDTLEAHGILAIARIVVFKDSVTARLQPDWTIRRPDGSVWRDKKGIAWVNPFHRELWNYNIGIAEELVKLGFDEIQFDYIRFPEPYKSLPAQVFPGQEGRRKPEVLAEFLGEAGKRLNALGVRSTADIFGLVTSVPGALEIGQEWEKVAPVTDVLLPMTYPSHYPRGSYGIARPNHEPYAILLAALQPARRRNTKLGLDDPYHVRPWLQAFTLGQPAYGAHHVKEQIRATYDAGYEGWVLWHPGSKYDPFLPAIEKELRPRAKR